jgi:HYDIN/CFA65/VesB family protein/ASPM-SPD-2-Hydin domain-containing protein
MQVPTPRREHAKNVPRCLQNYPVFALLATIVASVAAVGLSSCAGSTTAAGSSTSSTLSASTGTVDFGNVDVNGSAIEAITFTNAGKIPIDISGATVSGAGFSIASGNIASTIPVGQSLSVQVQFAPRSPGNASGTFTLTSDASSSDVTSSGLTSTVTSDAKSKSPFKVSLKGNGTQAGLTISPSSLSFSNGIVGQTSTQVVKLTNGGSSNLQLSAAAISGAQFGMSGLTVPATIPSGQSISFSVQFTPTLTGTTSGTISFTDNAPGSPQTLALTGSAVSATAQLSANPTSMNFGNVQVGSSSLLAATFTNTGNSDVTISNVTVSGTGYSASGVASGLILAPSQSATLTVTFAPTGLSNAPGSVIIASNATNSPVTISLSGESHIVLLSWTASTSTDVSGYNIYRATASGGYGAAPLNSTPVSGTTYTDSSVSGSQTYFYVVRAVASGVASSDSNEVTASIP